MNIVQIEFSLVNPRLCAPACKRLWVIEKCYINLSYYYQHIKAREEDFRNIDHAHVHESICVDISVGVQVRERLEQS